MKPSTTSVALAAVSLTLVACAPSQEAIQARTFGLAETSQPAKNFSDYCLATLPDFSGLQALVDANGLEKDKAAKDVDFYVLPGEKIQALSFADSDEGTACGVFFIGDADTAGVGAQFLETAKARTGGEPKKKYPSSFFEYAYHLNNGSVLTHDVRRKRGQTRHIFQLSIPVPEEDVADYIYN